MVAEPAQVKTLLGDRFMITTEITNTGAAPSGEILAHLNVASIEGSVYVDPEDWSPSRSQQLSLQPGESRKLSGKYRLSMPATLRRTSPCAVRQRGSRSEALMISPLVNVDVASRSTLTAGGALPVVLSPAAAGSGRRRSPLPGSPSRYGSMTSASAVGLPEPQPVPINPTAGSRPRSR